MQPRDILTPAATLLGLVLAAIGLSNAIVGISAILQTLSLVLVLIVILFAGAVLITCAASLRRSRSLLRAAIVLYAMGWAFTGVVVSLFLLGYAWGIQIFQISIPQIPNLDIATVLSSVAFTFSAAATLISYRKGRINKRELIELTRQLVADTDKTRTISHRELDVDYDHPKTGLLGLSLELHSLLRKKAMDRGLREKEAKGASMQTLATYLRIKGAIDPATANSISHIWHVRNMLLHSEGDVSIEDARVALSLLEKVLSQLSVESP